VAADVQMTTERHSIELIYPEDPILVEGDDLRLDQMLQNLLQNAIKYSPAGGPITVQLQRDDVSAVLSVSDQGIGIPQEVYSRLFQPYYRAGNSAGSVIGGMGLGLYVVKELVERHNGSIEVISAEGQGSTFIVRLPLVVAYPLAD
jgi:signal transduction histidine kinase